MILLITSGTAVFADHPEDSLGLGIIIGASGGIGGFGGAEVGVSFKIPRVPLFWAGFVSIHNDYVGLGLTGDYYFFDRDLVTEENFNLDWFLGLGGYVGMGFGDPFGFNLGIRVPVGLSWHINGQFELFADLVPSLGFEVFPDVEFPDFGIGGDLGLRYWF